jgi:putative transposase
MISPADRRQAVALIKEAVAAGARQHKACAVSEISARTYQRWTQSEAVLSDRRPGAQHPVPANKLSDEEREAILAVANSPAFCSLPSGQMVPALAGQGHYLASESTVYRILREAVSFHPYRATAFSP